MTIRVRFGIQLPVQILAVAYSKRLWGSYLSSLYLNFLFCKVEMVTKVPTSQSSCAD